MKKATLGAAWALAGILTATFATATSAAAQTAPPEDVTEYNLSSCTADGQTAFATFSVEGNSQGKDETGALLSAMFRGVVGKYSAEQFNNNAPPLVREMNDNIAAAKKTLGNMDMIINGAADGTTAGCALK